MGGAQRKGPFARQVHERERDASLGQRWLHDRNSTIIANSKIVNVRIWINPVISKIVFQPLHSDTDMFKNSINGVETIVRDGRGFNMTLDAHSFELVHQETSLSTGDFYNHPEKITDVSYAEMVEMFKRSHRHQVSHREERRQKNLSYSLKVDEFTDFDNQ